MAYSVGIDIGGTFTDAVLLDESGTARLLKTPTTLHDPSEGVNNALALAEQELGLEAGAILKDVDYFGLGTTVATNALIERKGVKTGIITTKGFRDAILMQRATGHWAGRELHEVMRDSARRQAEPVVDRPLIREVTERIDYKGAIVTPLDEAEVRTQVQALLDDGVEAIAVCLLWSFREPCHEQRVAAIIREMAPDVYLSVSSDLAPVLGEYERTATTALNAYLGPGRARLHDQTQRLAAGPRPQGLAAHPGLRRRRHHTRKVRRDSRFHPDFGSGRRSARQRPARPAHRHAERTDHRYGWHVLRRRHDHRLRARRHAGAAGQRVPRAQAGGSDHRDRRRRRFDRAGGRRTTRRRAHQRGFGSRPGLLRTRRHPTHRHRRRRGARHHRSVLLPGRQLRAGQGRRRARHARHDRQTARDDGVRGRPRHQVHRRPPDGGSARHPHRGSRARPA